MLKEGIEWTAERFRKGVEFEVEGTMVKVAAEGTPHAAATILGLTLVEARWITAGVAGAVIAVWLVVKVVRLRRARRSKGDALPEVFNPLDHEC